MDSRCVNMSSCEVLFKQSFDLDFDKNESLEWEFNQISLVCYFAVLKAINEDSPTVPTLLTDYILKVLCPT